MPSTVVVVDDEPAIVDLVCDALTDAEITAEGCPHGHRAYGCIQYKHPELVILDIQMPGVDGIELFWKLRDNPATHTLPVIFFTANAQVLYQRLPNYHALGATFLPKPFNINKLLDLVRKNLS